jgi:PhnB protein
MSNNNAQIVPMLAYEDGIAAIEWLCKSFGFSEKNRILDETGKLIHGEIAFGNGTIILASPTEAYQSPKHHRRVCELAAKWYQSPFIINGVLVYVDNIEDHYQRSKECGANILSGIEKGGPGARYRVEDLEGQRWMFMERQ